MSITLNKSWDRGQALQLKGQLADAIAEYRKAVELDDDPFALALLGQAYARAGQRDEAQKIRARLTEEAKSRYVAAYGVALMFIGLGDKEQAMDALERAFREGAGNDLLHQGRSNAGRPARSAAIRGTCAKSSRGESMKITNFFAELKNFRRFTASRRLWLSKRHFGAYGARTRNLRRDRAAL